MFHNLRKIDWHLTVCALLLSGTGLLTIYGIGTEDSFGFFKRQLFWLAGGFLLMLVLSFFDYRIFKDNTFVLAFIYLLALSLLVIVLGARTIRGAASWLHLGFFRVEPVELAKIVIIIFLARYFSLHHIEMYRVRHLIVSGFYVGLPMMMVLFQPDFGSALALLSIWFCLVLIAGIKLRHFLVLILLVVLLFAVGWFFFLRDYQKQRIIVFLNPESDPRGSGYNISQSLIAIGSAGLFGRGMGFNSQAGLKFLPEQHTDFIFATFAEQWGLLGVSGLLCLFALLLWRIVKIALSSLNNFGRLFGAGLAIMLFTQILVNIGMNLGLLPVTGLTLPLVSYGGSSVLSIFLGIGILQSIKART